MARCLIFVARGKIRSVMIKTSCKSIIWSALGLLAVISGLTFFLNFTDPISAGSIGVLSVFVLVYLATFFAGILTGRAIRIVYFALRATGESAKDVPARKSSRGGIGRRALLIIGLLSFVPVFLISINSIGQISFLNIMFIVAIEAIAIFYISRRF